MREVLFRAKHIHICLENKHLDGIWVCGYLRDNNYINRQDEDEYGNQFTSEVLVDPETVCEYTGYRDLRKKHVFEHDIVFCEETGCHGHVVFKDGKFMIKWEKAADYLISDIHFWFSERRMYVVGNIFDNPELLEGGRKNADD